MKKNFIIFARHYNSEEVRDIFRENARSLVEAKAIAFDFLTSFQTHLYPPEENAVFLSIGKIGESKLYFNQQIN